MFHAYIENLELEFEDYKSLIAKEPNQPLRETEWFIDYQNWFDKLTETVNLKKSNAFKQLDHESQKGKLEKLFFDKVLPLECKKFYYFLLTQNQNLLIVKTGTDKEEQRNFLGYEKKKGKRDAGLKMYLEEGRHITMLYDELDKFNEEKANSLINKVLSGNKVSVDGDLLKHINYKGLYECIDFKSINFDLQIMVSGQNRINYKQFWKLPDERLIRLKEICEFAKGTSTTKERVTEGGYPVIAGGKISAYSHNKYNFSGDVITVSASGANAGYIWYHPGKIYASDCSVIKSIDSTKFQTKAIYQLLQLLQDAIYNLQRGQAQLHVYISDLESIKIPILSFKQQEIFLKEVELIEQKESNLIYLREEAKKDISNVISTTYNSNYSSIMLDTICSYVQYGISLQMNTINKGYKIFRMNEIVNNRMFDGGSMKCVDIQGDEFQKYKLNKGDILFNRTNSYELVGKTGIFELEGDYCFASYLIRLVIDPTKANPWFVNLMMNSDFYQQEAKSLATKSINQSNINAQKMQGIKIPLPDLKIQNEIANKAIELEAKITSLMGELSKIPKEKENILTKYLNSETDNIN